MNARAGIIERCIEACNRHDAAEFASAWTGGGTLRQMAIGRIDEGREQIAAGAEERF